MGGIGILSWILIGLAAGALAKVLLPGKDPGGLILTILIGIVGAVVGGYASTRLGYGPVSGFNAPSLLIATLGALAFLVVLRRLRGKKEK